MAGAGERPILVGGAGLADLSAATELRVSVHESPHALAMLTPVKASFTKPWHTSHVLRTAHRVS